MSDSKKTKKELIAELEALRAKMGGKQADEPASEPTATGDGLTRRDILATAWVAPIILTVPLGAAISQRAQAQGGTPGTSQPTSQPTAQPTSSPTQLTAAPQPPTSFPTAAGSDNAIPVELSDFDIS